MRRRNSWTLPSGRSPPTMAFCRRRRMSVLTCSCAKRGRLRLKCWRRRKPRDPGAPLRSTSSVRVKIARRFDPQIASQDHSTPSHGLARTRHPAGSRGEASEGCPHLFCQRSRSPAIRGLRVCSDIHVYCTFDGRSTMVKRPYAMPSKRAGEPARRFTLSGMPRFHRARCGCRNCCSKASLGKYSPTGEGCPRGQATDDRE